MLNYSKTPEPFQLTIKHYDVKVTIELPWDTSLEEVFNTLRGALVAAGWSSSQFDSEIKNQAESLQDLEDYLERQSKNNDELT